MTTLFSAADVLTQITAQESYNFGLYYSRSAQPGYGINVKVAEQGYSISNYVLNAKDIATLEAFLATKGITSSYSVTKAKNWARCQTMLDKKVMVDLAKHLRDNKIKFGK